MSGAVTCWGNDPPHRNIAIVPQIIGHCGSTVLAQLLVHLFCSSFRRIPCDFDQVTIGLGRESDKLVEVGLRCVVQGVFTGRIVDDRFGNCFVVVEIGNSLVNRLDCTCIHHCNGAGRCRHRTCCVGSCLRLICGGLRGTCRSNSLVSC